MPTSQQMLDLKQMLEKGNPEVTTPHLAHRLSFVDLVRW